jgi:transcriptional regulator with XRE-family HTH domain
MVLELAPETQVQRRAVGQRIREWRLRRELSQADVARTAGITQASLSNYENGKRDMPLSTLLGVTGALNVSLGDVLDVPEVIVVRDSALGKAVTQLVQRPEFPRVASGEAAG